MIVEFLMVLVTAEEQVVPCIYSLNIYEPLIKTPINKTSGYTHAMPPPGVDY